MPAIDRSSPVPLYVQLKQILLEQIRQRHWCPGELIPSENALEEMYGLSRITVRQALGELVNDGYLDRQRGRGTFVTRPKFVHDPARRRALTDTMVAQGVRPGWRVLGSGLAAAPADIAGVLELPAEERVLCLKRLRLADEEIIGYHLAYLPERFAEHADPGRFERGGSLHYLRSLPALADSKAQRALEALAADAEVAAQLQVALGAPVLRIERLTSSASGTPLEFMRASYRGDRFTYHVAL